MFGGSLRSSGPDLIQRGARSSFWLRRSCRAEGSGFQSGGSPACAGDRFGLRCLDAGGPPEPSRWAGRDRQARLPDLPAVGGRPDENRRHGLAPPLRPSRRTEVGTLGDEIEAAYDRGWTDGLPVVAPTAARVLRMLDGTRRPPDEVVAVVPPDLVPATVEKVAINAVLAGCRPDYLPVVLAAVEAACTDAFNMHGLLCTTYFSGPVVIVNGPIAAQIGMASGVNCLGQGNRANAT